MLFRGKRNCQTPNYAKAKAWVDSERLLGIMLHVGNYLNVSTTRLGGLGFRVWGLEFRVWGLGFRV